jgi:hypothetical protein
MCQHEMHSIAIPEKRPLHHRATQLDFQRLPRNITITMIRPDVNVLRSTCDECGVEGGLWIEEGYLYVLAIALLANNFE